MKYKAIIFDIDGTLLNTLDSNFYSLIRIIKEELNEDYTFEEAIKFAPYAGIETLKLLGIKDIENVYQRWVRYVNEYPLAKPYPHIIEMFEKIKNNYLIGIVSSKKHKQYHIDMHQLDTYIKEKVLEEDTTHHKPHPEPLLKCMELLNVSPEEVLFIGDTQVDYDATRNVHCDFGYASWGSYFDIDGEPEYIFHDPLEIGELL